MKLESPDDVQLAYAQAASAIEYIIATVGQEGLREIMKKMAASEAEGASESIKTVMGIDFREFERGWKEFLSSKHLQAVDGVNVPRLKIKGGLVDEERLDMEEIKSLVARNRAHLGDRLKERGRMDAAAIEYRRALADHLDSVPVLDRLSAVLISLGKEKEALEHLFRARELSPDHPAAHTYLGKIFLKQGDFRAAQQSFQTSIEINPFDPDIHLGLAEAYEGMGDNRDGLKEREIARKLMH